jgi:type II secretory pathway pseudopilin PulG
MWVTVIGSLTAIFVAALTQLETLRPDVNRGKRLLRDLEIRDKLRPGTTRASLDTAIEAGVVQMLEARVAVRRRLRVVIWTLVGAAFTGIAIFAAVALARSDDPVDDAVLSLIAALAAALAGFITAATAWRERQRATRALEITSELELAEAYRRWAGRQGATVHAQPVQGQPFDGRLDLTVLWPDGREEVVETVVIADTRHLKPKVAHVRKLARRADSLGLGLNVVVSPSQAGQFAAELRGTDAVSVWTSPDGRKFERVSSP